MSKPLPTLPLVTGLVLASAGVEALVAATPTRAWLPVDLLVLFGLSAVGTLPFLAPALVAGWRWPRRRAGLVLASLVLLHAAVALRFGPLVNASAASPLLLGSWLGLALILGLGGWFLSPSLDRLPRTSPWVLAGLGPVLLGAGLLRGGLPHEEPGASGPSVLLVTLDTVRRDKLGTYGGPVSTPTLDALAARGVVFDQAVSVAPQTGPSHLSILTGRDPLSHGLVANGTPVGDQPTSLAQALSQRGWHTAAFVSGFPVHSRFGLSQGFDLYDDDFSARPGLHGLAAVRAWDALVTRNTPRERRGDQVNGAVRRWLARQPPEPWFAWVHYYDPHGPYTPPAPWALEVAPSPGDGSELDLPAYWPPRLRQVGDLSWHERSYEAELAWTDHLLGELLEMVGEQEVLVVVTADHGEHMTEHGVLFDHGDDLYDTALDVPLVVAGPGVVEDVRVGCQVPLVDIAPSILDLLDARDGRERDGRSLAGALRGAPCQDRDAYAGTVTARHTDTPPVDYSLRRPLVKVIHSSEDGARWYDLLYDPGEEEPRRDLPAEASILEARMDESPGVIYERGDAATQQMLKELGYQE